MKFSKGSVVITAIIGVLVLIIIGGGVWYFVANKPKANPPVTDDQFKDWKTYTNTKYGYEFKYPSTGVQDPISFANSGNPVAFSSNDFSVDSATGAVKSGFDINIELNVNKTFGQGNMGLPGTVERESSTLWGKTANIITSSNSQGNYYGYEILRATKPMYVYVRYGSSGDFALSTFNQILSTFKFTEKDETVNWETYTNEKYGFEVKLPNSFNNYKINTRVDVVYESVKYIMFQVPTSDKYSQDFGGSIGFATPFIIGVYPISVWQKISSEEGPKPTKITQNDKFVFTYSQWQAPPEDLINIDFKVPQIISTFKFTK